MSAHDSMGVSGSWVCLPLGETAVTAGDVRAGATMPRSRRRRRLAGFPTSCVAGHVPRLRRRASKRDSRRGPISAYIGFDPSATSAPRRPPRADLRRSSISSGTAAGPVAVVGGGTGMIGDPSGKSSRAQPARRGDDRGERRGDAAAAGALPRLRRARAARMVEQPRLAGRDVGCSTSCATSASTSRSRTCSPRTRSRRGWSGGTVVHRVQLHDPPGRRLPAPPPEMGVELQMGGADQWGNITAGLELIRGRARDGGARRRGVRPPARCCSRRRARSSASPSGRPSGSIRR